MSSPAAAWGPPLISTFLASVIYGVTVLQTFYYYNHYGKSDRVAWLILVGVLFILDSAALALFMYCVYYYSITSWGNIDMLAPDVKEFPSEYFITAVVAFIVQLFYINTIRALRTPPIIVIVLLFTALTALATSLILPVVQLRLHDVMKIVVDPLNHLAFNIARGTALACDLGIVATLCWQLSIRRSEVQRANNMVNAILMFTVQRGILQAIVQAGEVLSYAIQPSGIYFLPFHVIVSRIYCTSLLATLNSREYVASKGELTFDRAQKRGRKVGEKREHVSDIRFNPPQAANADQDQQASGRPSISRALTSVVSASRPVLSSFLEPPFLFTNDAGSGNQMDSVGDEYTHSMSAPYPPPGIDTTQSGSWASDVEKSAASEEHAYPMLTMNSGHTKSNMTGGSEADVSQTSSNGWKARRHQDSARQ